MCFVLAVRLILSLVVLVVSLITHRVRASIAIAPPH
jgi:hypothetical protein